MEPTPYTDLVWRAISLYMIAVGIAGIAMTIGWAWAKKHYGPPPRD